MNYNISEPVFGCSIRVSMHPAAGDPAFDAGVHAGAERSGHVRAHTHLHAVSSQEG